jgi:hypothetical protein
MQTDQYFWPVGWEDGKWRVCRLDVRGELAADTTTRVRELKQRVAELGVQLNQSWIRRLW